MNKSDNIRIHGAFAAFLYLAAFYAWYMSFSIGPFQTLAWHHADEPFSFWELTKRTWEYFHFSWPEFCLLVIPAGAGYAISARRSSRRAFFLASAWLSLCCIYYFTATFEGELGYQASLRSSPEFQARLPWAFHALSCVARFLNPFIQLFLLLFMFVLATVQPLLQAMSRML